MKISYLSVQKLQGAVFTPALALYTFWISHSGWSRALTSRRVSYLRVGSRCSDLVSPFLGRYKVSAIHFFYPFAGSS